MSKDKESWDTVFAGNLAFPRMEHERIKGILSTLKNKLTTAKNSIEWEIDLADSAEDKAKFYPLLDYTIAL